MIQEFEKVKSALGIESRQDVVDFLDIATLDVREYLIRMKLEERFGLYYNSDELTYILPDDNLNAMVTRFMVYLTDPERGFNC